MGRNVVNSAVAPQIGRGQYCS